VTQPQLPSTAAVFPLPCSGLHFQGGNGTNNAMGGAQFNRAPQTRILVSLGASPNAAAVFSITSPSIENTFENLTIDGHNQALSIFASVDNTLKNVCLAVQTSGQTDNTALKITNSFWFFMDGGCLKTLSMTIPVAMFTGETPIAGENPLVGLVYFTNIQGHRKAVASHRILRRAPPRSRGDVARRHAQASMALTAMPWISKWAPQRSGPEPMKARVGNGYLK
jgi:hypothetical protein